MERKIAWVTGCYEAIELVYQKAEADEETAVLLSALEERALREMGQQCSIGRVKKNGQALTKEWYEQAADADREGLLRAFGGNVLKNFHVDLFPPKCTATFSPLFPQLIGCAMFDVINRLEKLDGAIQIVAGEDKVELELQEPEAEKPGMEEILALLMKLYPWLDIHETSTGAKGAAPIRQ